MKKALETECGHTVRRATENKAKNTIAMNPKPQAEIPQPNRSPPN